MRAFRQVLPETSIAVQKSSLETRPNLESSQTRFKIISTNQNAPSDQRILKSVTKIVTQRRNSLDKTVYGARQPNAIKPHSNIRINQW